MMEEIHKQEVVRWRTGEQNALSRGEKQCMQRPGGKKECVVVGSQRSGWLEYGVDQGISLLGLL